MGQYLKRDVRSREELLESAGILKCPTVGPGDYFYYHHCFPVLSSAAK